MTLTVVVVDRHFDGQRIHVSGLLIASGSYVTGGDTLNFSHTNIKSSRAPVWCTVDGVNGFVYGWVLGATLQTQRLTAHEAGAQGSALDEVAAGAYPVGITTDVPRFHAIFPSR